MSAVPNICLAPYSRVYLDLSWRWLNDPEIKRLTMTPDFSREDQQRFYRSLAAREGYWIWGVSAQGKPVGAAGLKNPRGQTIEYWGYLGERSCWGRGLGGEMLGAVEHQARLLGFEEIDLKVDRHNARAVALYHRSGYRTDDPDADVMTMRKALGR